MDEGADRPANEPTEIEVTPEMVEAGVVEFCHFDSRFEDETDAVVRVYRVMAALAPSLPRKRMNRSQTLPKQTGP